MRKLFIAASVLLLTACGGGDDKSGCSWNNEATETVDNVSTTYEFTENTCNEIDYAQVSTGDHAAAGKVLVISSSNPDDRPEYTHLDSYQHRYNYSKSTGEIQQMFTTNVSGSSSWEVVVSIKWLISEPDRVTATVTDPLSEYTTWYAEGSEQWDDFFKYADIEMNQAKYEEAIKHATVTIK
ncbi:hypothetical protein L2735_14120 [Shewanella olleyana]|uniref:hypothetical protein n=1 Tax=Shewanella olleyana TaxID=135626 RepID=UPI00200E0F7C|nr:hypothetical protein [Shewanella olleyana]MCL1067927.1 hypothetical protein [Shewanella olleyana]